MFKKAFLLLFVFSTFVFCVHSQVGIGTNTPSASAQLEVNSTTKGFLPPRVALTSTTAATPITSPASGLLVFNTATAGVSPNQVTPGYYYWDGVNSKWVSLLADNLGNHTATKNVLLNGFYLSNDGGNEGIAISNTGNVGIGNNAPTQTLDVTGTGKFSASLINNGARTYFGNDGANMHWFGTSDPIAEPNNLGYGFESNGTSIQSHKWNVGGVERLKIDASGNTNVTGTLNVTGKINLTDPSGNVTVKSANFVAAGTAVSLDGVSVSLTTSGNRSLQIKSTTGSFNAIVSAYTTFNGSSFTYFSGAAQVVSSTYAYLGGSWHFPGDGDVAVYYVRDISNTRFFRITLMIGPSYANNFISIEQLL